MVAGSPLLPRIRVEGISPLYKPVKNHKGSSEHSLEVSVIIDYGEEKKEARPDDSLGREEDPLPVFSYQVHNPAVPNNSYRRFMEMQQQQ